MRRKIIPHGPSSMTISLPSSWVKSHNLKKGEELEVVEEDNNLSIKPLCTSDSSKKIEISFIDLDTATEKNIILALHKKGYDEIKINFNKPNMIKEIHSFLNTMQLGFEIIKQEKDSMLIKSISSPESEQFDNLFRRIFRIAIEYSKKIEEAMNDDEDITNSFLLHETSVIRISNYCKRILIKEKKENACFLYVLINNLAMMVQNLTFIIEEIREKNKTFSKEFNSKFREIHMLLEKTYNLYYKFSFKEYACLNSLSENINTQINKAKSKDPSESQSWEHLSSINKELKSSLYSILIIQF